MEAAIERILISPESLKTRVSALAGEIVDAFGEAPDGVTIVAILSGSIIFLADLIRELPMRMRIALVPVSSYPGRTTRSRGAKLESAALPDLAGRDVLLVDDILDTGGTLRLVQREVAAAGPRSVRTAVLLRKRDKASPDVSVDFVGFDIEDVFVVGYGLDFDGLHRNLPYVGVLRNETDSGS